MDYCDELLCDLCNHIGDVIGECFECGAQYCSRCLGTEFGYCVECDGSEAIDEVEAIKRSYDMKAFEEE